MRRQALIFSKCSTLLIVLISLFISFGKSESQNLLQRGSSLSVEDTSNVLTSTDKTFTCGFYSLGENAYWFSIWFTHSQERTVVWTANRETPVNGKGSKVFLQQNGDMVFRDVDGTVIWRTDTSSSGADRAELLESGNLVLKDIDGNILWQIFDFPTDTLLPNQSFTKRRNLVSRSGPGAFASGYFRLYFNDENVLRLMYDAPDISSVYWPDPDYSLFQNGRTRYNSSNAVAVLDERGNFLSSDWLQFSALDMGFGIKRRLTIDYDGNLRLYSLNNTGLWMVSWIALLQQCQVHGVCGKNGICTYAPDKLKCSCPPGFEVTERGNWNKGCKPMFKRSLTTNSKQVKFITVLKVDFSGFDLNFTQPSSKEDCMKLCLDDFRCEAYTYRIREQAASCFI